MHGFGACQIRAFIASAQTKHLLQPVGNTAGQITEVVKDLPDNTLALVFIQLLPVQLPFVSQRTGSCSWM